MRFLLACTLSLLPSCAEEGTSLMYQADLFSMRITAMNAAGQPVPGLRVSAWNSLTGFGTDKKLQDLLAANTTLWFEVSTLSRIDLSVLELDGTLATKPIDQLILMPGVYAVSLSLPRQVGTHVYKCLLLASDSVSASIVFRDSIYAVLWQPDPLIAILGWTSQDGSFETNDTLLFPNLLSLPTLIRTSSGAPDSIGTFTIPDSIVICLTDTVSNLVRYYYQEVIRGTNSFTLQWDSSASNPLDASSPLPNESAKLLRVSRSRPGSWKLWQNFPNPFN